MGFFDFLRRKQDPQLDPAILEKMLAEPRCHHYTLAHYALRMAAFANPEQFIGILISPNAHAFLTDVLENVSSHCREQGAESDFTAEGIEIHQLRIGTYPGVIIQMPPAQTMSEAHFVAAVLLADVEQAPIEGAEVALRYFTLEKGFELGGGDRTVVCEWTTEGSHVNYGDGPTPSVEQFGLAIEELLSGNDNNAKASARTT